MRDRTYYVYVLASRSRNLYTGFTNDLMHRVFEHRQGIVKGFTSKYRVHRLVYFEPFRDVRDAIAREKQLKRWRREKKVALVEARNPAWDDLAAGWFEEKQVPRLPRPLKGHGRGRSG